MPTRDNWRPYLRRREEAKHQKYDVPCTREGWNFAAFAVGSWGGLGPETAKVFSRMLKRSTAWEGPNDKGTTQRAQKELVGVALFQQIFRLLRAKNHVT